jgi:hypothetical protein
MKCGECKHFNQIVFDTFCSEQSNSYAICLKSKYDICDLKNENGFVFEKKDVFKIKRGTFNHDIICPECSNNILENYEQNLFTCTKCDYNFRLNISIEPVVKNIDIKFRFEI